jgi:thioesterase domain-containing protein
MLVARTQQPGVVHAPMLFFSTISNPPSVTEKVEIWRSYIDVPIEAVELDCDHSHMMLPEPAARIGSALSDRLARISAVTIA